MTDKPNGKAKNDVLSRIVGIMNAIGCVWTAILMLLVTVDVGGRFFFNSPLTGTTEIVQASIIGITFLQFAYVQYINQHLSVTVLYDKFGKNGKKAVDLISLLLGITVFGVVVYSGWNFFLQAVRTGEYEGSPASIMLPSSPVRFIIVFCSVVMIIVQVTQIVKTFRKKREV